MAEVKMETHDEYKPTVIADLPDNSYKNRSSVGQGMQDPAINDIPKPKEDKDKHLDKVVKGEVLVKKPSVWKKVKIALFGDGSTDIKGYLAREVILPTIKDTTIDVILGALEMAFYGESRGRTSRRRSSRDARNRTSYTRYYEERDRDRRRDRYDDYDDRYSRPMSKYEDVYFSTRDDAEGILDELCELIDQYGEAPVRAFYELAGISTSFTDEQFGWTNLSTAYIRNTRDGYLLVLPNPRRLDRR